MGIRGEEGEPWALRGGEGRGWVRPGHHVKEARAAEGSLQDDEILLLPARTTDHKLGLAAGFDLW